MEVISIERSTYEELLTSFNSFVAKMKEMAFSMPQAVITVFSFLHIDQ